MTRPGNNGGTKEKRPKVSKGTYMEPIPSDECGRVYLFILEKAGWKIGSRSDRSAVGSEGDHVVKVGLCIIGFHVDP